MRIIPKELVNILKPNGYKLDKLNHYDKVKVEKINDTFRNLVLHSAKSKIENESGTFAGELCYVDGDVVIAPMTLLESMSDRSHDSIVKLLTVIIDNNIKDDDLDYEAYFILLERFRLQNKD